MQICNKNSCTGCSACYNICPKKAISMVEDENGSIIPEVDMNKCVNCNMCKKVCPENNEIEYTKPIKVYASWSLDENIRKTSSSGGLAYEIYKYFVHNNGVAVGTKFNENMELKTQVATTLIEVEEFKGSKYVQSLIGDVFLNIKENLLNNKKVVFVGTPCQVMGLKNYLKNVDIQNLFLIDLICHGVPPQKYLKDYLKYLDLKDKIDTISFRGKNNWHFTAYKNDKIIYMKHNKEDLYYKAFLNCLFYRENCYSCKYAKPERVSDISLGDFWGLGKIRKFDYSVKDGVSLILVNSEKGSKLIEDIKDRIFLEERTLEEAMEGNAQLNHPSQKKEITDEFKKLYREQGFNVAIDEVIRKGM